jgi:hypothetical protein
LRGYAPVQIEAEAWAMNLSKYFLVCGIAVCIASPLSGHHSTLAQTTSERTAIRGTITKVEWVNPHVRLDLDVMDAVSGRVVKWRIEADSVAVLKSKRVALENLKIRSVITVRGVERTGHVPRIMEVPEPDPTWKN